MKTSVILLLLSVSFSNLLAVTNAQVLKEVLAWKTLDWKFKSKDARDKAIEEERFIPGNALPSQIEYLYDRRIAIITPRFKEGIPATLSTVRESQMGCGNEGPKSPLLKPYPNWKWNDGEMACDGLTSVTAAKADVCGRLWVLDSGVVDMINPYRTTVCSTKIVAFDLASDEAVREITFGDYILKSNSILFNLAVDVVTCEKVYLYSADSEEFALIVTDAESGDSWRVEHKLFYPYPNWGTLISEGDYVDLMLGVYSLAIDPITRNLFFHSLSSARKNFVSTRVVRNETLTASKPQEFYFSNGEATSQSPMAIFDDRGIMYFGLVSSGSLVCWNPAVEHTPENMVTIAHNPEKLSFIIGLSMDRLNIAWFLNVNFIPYMRGTMKNDEVNFRVLVANTRDLTQGTKCENPFQQQPYGGQQFPPQYGGAPYPAPYPGPYPQPGYGPPYGR